MTHEIIISGFGGQGVLSMGKILAYSGLMEDKEVTWMPAYGPEQRGGTANVTVIVSDEPVSSPILSSYDTAIVLNQPSLEKFESKVVPGGSIFVNSSMIDVKVQRTDVNAYYIPCNELAAELGNNKVANMIMLGAYLGYSKCVDIETVLKALLEKLGERKAKLIPLNREALLKGAACVK